MKPFYWIILLLGGILSVLLLTSGISLHAAQPSILDVSEAEYKSVITNTLAGHSKYFSSSNITIADVQYVETTVAVVKATTKDNQSITFLFEYYNGTVFLTNYSTTGFTSKDVNNSAIVPYISGAIDQN